MKTSQAKEISSLSQRLHLYAQRYRETRTVPWLVMASWVLVTNALIFGGMILAGHSGAPRHWVFPVIGVAVALAGFGSMIWGDLVMGFGGISTIWKASTRYYRKDGFVPQEEPWAEQGGRLRMLLRSSVIMVWFLPIFGHQWLVLHGVLSVGSMLPLSVLYMAPFMIFAYWFFPRDKGRWFLFSPVLYAVYAFAPLAGAPIAFDRRHGLMMVVLGALGAQIVSALLGHAYNRYALFKLRQLASMEGVGRDETP